MKITRSTTNQFTLYRHNNIELQTYPAKSKGLTDYHGKVLPDLMVYDKDLGYFSVSISRLRAQTLLKKMRKTS